MKIKGKRRYARRTNITPIGEVVLATVAGVGVVTVFAMFPGLAYAIAPFVDKKRKYKKKTKDIKKQYINRTIDSLVRQGLLKRDFDKNGTERLRLTKKGEWEAGIRGHLKDKKKEAKWDGVWHVVVFDVPEEKRKIRGELRRAMESYGFYQLQKSVWVYPYQCEEFIKLIKDHLGISQDVLTMEVAHIENDRHLKQEFKL